jgi:protoporphyrinogen oxidase
LKGSNAQAVVIVGAGPAGLTAAYELARAGWTNITVLEASDEIGGLSRTVRFAGNRIDIGGHRFFSKSDWVMQWWLEMLPIADASEPHSMPDKAGQALLSYQGKSARLDLNGQPRAGGEAVMLVRDRISRILFAGKFFDYPLKLNVETALKLGPIRCLLFGLSYAWSQVIKRRPETTLEDFFINRFGSRLYHQFFREYTEKVWGRPCSQISAEWGAQRIKSLSVGKAMLHALRQLFAGKGGSRVEQTSLIEHFLYPKLGPGQMWETVAERLRGMGVKIRMNSPVSAMRLDGERITAVEYRDGADGEVQTLAADWAISTMPVRELVGGLRGAVPAAVSRIAAGLEYRDFITVGLLFSKLARKDRRHIEGRVDIPDNWIYVQEPGVKVGRVQLFNNWSPYLVARDDQIWVGLEYFCSEGDALWNMSDADLVALGKREMEQIGLANEVDCLDGVTIRMPKAYPGYYGSYARFGEVREFLDGIGNLFLIGRNGMHRYNNQDHSMLSAKAAAEAIVAGCSDKSAIWAINVDDDYHEEVDKQ